MTDEEQIDNSELCIEHHIQGLIPLHSILKYYIGNFCHRQGIHAALWHSEATTPTDTTTDTTTTTITTTATPMIVNGDFFQCLIVRNGHICFDDLLSHTKM